MPLEITPKRYRDRRLQDTSHLANTDEIVCFLPIIGYNGVISNAFHPLAMSEKNRMRQEAFTKRRQAEGLKRFQFWATPEEKAYLKKALDDYRNNGDIPKETTHEIIKTDPNAVQVELLKGEVLSIVPKYPIYTIDKSWDNLLYWNNPLPKGIIVFADSHKRVKKWRAVKLNGLGAFPVLWAIRYSLEQRCWELARKDAPRTRKINFSKFDVQTEIQLMVGNAKLKVDERVKGSSLGFLLHPIEAEAVTVSCEIVDQMPGGVLVVVIDERGNLIKTNAVCPRIEEILLWKHGQPGLRRDEVTGTWHAAMEVLSSACRASF